MNVNMIQLEGEKLTCQERKFERESHDDSAETWEGRSKERNTTERRLRCSTCYLVAFLPPSRFMNSSSFTTVKVAVEMVHGDKRHLLLNIFQLAVVYFLSILCIMLNIEDNGSFRFPVPFCSHSLPYLPTM